MLIKIGEIRSTSN